MIVGLDMGGTHIDAVIIEDGKIIKIAKEATDRSNLFQSIWNCLKILLEGLDKSKIKKINLSTTISTNAIVEDKISEVAMLIQSGPGIKSDFLACGHENIFISGYTDHRGEIVKDFNLDEIKEAISSFKEKGIENCAVVTKFSTRNPTSEIEIANLMKDSCSHVTMGHRLSGKLNFPRRVFTSYLNSAVHSSFKDFALYIRDALEREGIGAPLFVLKADGGTISLESAEERPVETILSGPAASLMGINTMLRTDKDAVLLDIGGTTTDIFFLADGTPLFEPLGIEIGPYKTLVRSIYSFSMALGGDSSITVEGGQLKLGPRRKGPAYAFGGPSPTPTDALIVLGHMDNIARLKACEEERAYQAIKLLSGQLNLSVEEAAQLIIQTMTSRIKNKVDELLRVINSKPVYTIKELLDGRLVQPQVLNLIGGPARALAPRLEEEFNLATYYPKHYKVANAIGAGLAKTTTEISVLADTSKGTLAVPELGIYKKIGGDYDLNSAKKYALDLLAHQALTLGAKEDELETEITEENSFNMVRGFYTSGQNIRVKAQIKPGLAQALRSEIND